MRLVSHFLRLEPYSQDELCNYLNQQYIKRVSITYNASIDVRGHSLEIIKRFMQLRIILNYIK